MRTIAIASGFLLCISAGVVQAQACPGTESADFGYKWVQSDSGFVGFRRAGRDYARFNSLPVLHGIDPRGPAGGKLMEGDTVISAGGHPAMSGDAAVLLNTPSTQPVTFVVRRTSGQESAVVTPRILCIPDVKRFQASWMGFGIHCDKCSAAPNADGSRSWSFPMDPAISQVERDSPAARAGMQRGDTLVAIDGIPLRTARGGARLGSIAVGQSVTWTIRRAGRNHVLTVVASKIHDD